MQMLKFQKILRITVNPRGYRDKNAYLLRFLCSYPQTDNGMKVDFLQYVFNFQ